MFVDLGMSYSLVDARNQSGDAKGLLGLVKQMTDRAEGSDDIDWVGFKRMLDVETSGARYRGEVDKDLVGIFGKWKDVAEKARTDMKVSEVERIVELYEKAAQRKGRLTDDDVLDAAVGQLR